MQKCHAEKYCKQFNEERSNCHEYCIGYIQLQNIYKLSRLPKKYQHDIPLTNAGEDAGAYLWLKAFMENVEERVAAGHGAFIYSKKKGNGKTSWCSKIMNAYFRKVALRNNLTCRGLYVNVPEFLQQLRDNMNNPTEEMRDLIEDIKECELVLWDDIGTETPTTWVREQLYIFINHRDANNLSNLYTSNLPLTTLVEPKYLDERICDRIKGHAKVLEFVGESRRNFE